MKAVLVCLFAFFSLYVSAQLTIMNNGEQRRPRLDTPRLTLQSIFVKQASDTTKIRMLIWPDSENDNLITKYGYAVGRVDTKFFNSKWQPLNEHVLFGYEPFNWKNKNSNIDLYSGHDLLGRYSDSSKMFDCICNPITPK